MTNVLLMGPSVLYAISRMAGDLVPMLRFMNPRDGLADVYIFWMWLLKERLSLISMPRYLEPPTDSRIYSCSRYSLGTGDLASVTCITSHLLGLNSMSH